MTYWVSRQRDSGCDYPLVARFAGWAVGVFLRRALSVSMRVGEVHRESQAARRGLGGTTAHGSIVGQSPELASRERAHAKIDADPVQELYRRTALCQRPTRGASPGGPNPGSDRGRRSPLRSPLANCRKYVSFCASGSSSLGLGFVVHFGTRVAVVSTATKTQSLRAREE